MSDVNNRSVFKMTMYAIPALRLLTWNQERIFSNVHLKKRYWLSGTQFQQFPSPCDLYSHCVIQAQSALSSVWYCQEELVYWAIWNNYTGSSQGKGALVVTAIHRQQKAKERERGTLHWYPEDLLTGALSGISTGSLPDRSTPFSQPGFCQRVQPPNAQEEDNVSYCDQL